VPLLDDHAIIYPAGFPLHDTGTRTFRAIWKFVPCDCGLGSLPVSLHKDTRD
jgi:hypothetical protein